MLSVNGLLLIFIISNNILINYFVIWSLQFIFYRLLNLIPTPEYKVNFMNKIMFSINFLSDFLIICSIFIIYIYIYILKILILIVYVQLYIQCM